MSVQLFGMDCFQTTAEDLVEKLKSYGPFSCDCEDVQLGTEYLFDKIGVRLWRERAFHPKLLSDPVYVEKMKAVLEDEYQYQYFAIVAVR